jgi:nicotinamide-nucleotide amidase
MPVEEIVKCSKYIADKNLKIAFAESASAGWMASEFSLTPYSGKVLLGGIVCYDATIKQELFDISKDIIDKYTPESAEVTRLLAEKLGKFFNCDIAVAVTGLTAPGGSETPEKPVGTMFIHIVLPGGKYFSHREVFTGGPKEIIGKSIQRTGELLCDLVENLEVHQNSEA